MSGLLKKSVSPSHILFAEQSYIKYTKLAHEFPRQGSAEIHMYSKSKELFIKK